jgi:hypothetical protein
MYLRIKIGITIQREYDEKAGCNASKKVGVRRALLVGIESVAAPST